MSKLLNSLAFIACPLAVIGVLALESHYNIPAISTPNKVPQINSKPYGDTALPVEPTWVISGKGTLITKDGYVLTAGHVAKGQYGIYVTYHGTTFAASVYAIDTDSDLAILKINNSAGFDHVTLSTTPEKTLVNTKEPLVAGEAYDCGIFTKPNMQDVGFATSVDTKMFSTTFWGCPGYSGSGIFDTHGNQVGVLSVGYVRYGQPTGRTAYVGTDEINHFLSGLNLTTDEKNTTVLNRQEIKDKVEGSLVTILALTHDSK